MDISQVFLLRGNCSHGLGHFFIPKKAKTEKGKNDMSKYCPLMDGPTTYLKCLECNTKWCKAFFCLVLENGMSIEYAFLCEKLDHLLQRQNAVVVVSGRAGSLAERYAADRNYPCVIIEDGSEAHAYISRQKKKGIAIFWRGKPDETTNFQLIEKYKNPTRFIKV